MVLDAVQNIKMVQIPYAEGQDCATASSNLAGYMPTVVIGQIIGLSQTSIFAMHLDINMAVFIVCCHWI